MGLSTVPELVPGLTSNLRVGIKAKAENAVYSWGRRASDVDVGKSKCLGLDLDSCHCDVVDAKYSWYPRVVCIGHCPLSIVLAKWAKWYGDLCELVQDLSLSHSSRHPWVGFIFLVSFNSGVSKHFFFVFDRLSHGRVHIRRSDPCLHLDIWHSLDASGHTSMHVILSVFWGSFLSIPLLHHNKQEEGLLFRSIWRGVLAAVDYWSSAVSLFFFLCI